MSLAKETARVAPDRGSAPALTSLTASIPARRAWDSGGTEGTLSEDTTVTADTGVIRTQGTQSSNAANAAMSPDKSDSLRWFDAQPGAPPHLDDHPENSNPPPSTPLAIQPPSDPPIALSKLRAAVPPTSSTLERWEATDESQHGLGPGLWASAFGLGMFCDAYIDDCQALEGGGSQYVRAHRGEDLVSPKTDIQELVRHVSEHHSEDLSLFAEADLAALRRFDEVMSSQPQPPQGDPSTRGYLDEVHAFRRRLLDMALGDIVVFNVPPPTTNARMHARTHKRTHTH